jgi:exonuclease III
MADYTIGSFNTQNLNYQGNKDYRMFAKIIDTENFDIIAMQETINEGAIYKIKRYLRASYNWDYKWGQEFGRSDFSDDNKDPPNTRRNTAKGFTFLWNTRRFQLTNDNSPQFMSVRGTNIIRNPFIGRFIPVNGPFCEIRLMNIHLCNPNNIKDVKINEYRLVSELYKSFYSDRRPANNRAAYTLVLGDYNIPLGFCHECEKAFNLFTTTFLGGFDEKTTLITTETYQEETNNGKNPLIPANNYFANDYDHCSYNFKYFKERTINVRVSRINSVEKYCENDLPLHRKTISDHVPIKIELTLR